MSSGGDPRPVRLDDKTKPIMDSAIAREQSLSRLLMTYIVTGLIFMLLPGTFLGVWNLIKISSREAAESISPASYWKRMTHALVLVNDFPQKVATRRTVIHRAKA